MKCGICGAKHRDASLFVPSMYDNKTDICRHCSYAESMLDIKDACIYNDKKTPKQCGYSEDQWIALVLQTRSLTTDKYLKTAKVLGEV